MHFDNFGNDLPIDCSGLKIIIIQLLSTRRSMIASQIYINYETIRKSILTSFK